MECIVRGERLGLSLCAVPSPHGIMGSFDLRKARGHGTMKDSGQGYDVSKGDG